MIKKLFPTVQFLIICRINLCLDPDPVSAEAWIRIRIQYLDSDPVNPDPKHCFNITQIHAEQAPEQITEGKEL